MTVTDRIWNDENKLAVAQVCHLIPSSRSGGGSINPSTVHRWVHRGIRTPAGGVIKLEAVRCGAQWITSVQAVKRFIEALNEAGVGVKDADMPRGGRSPRKRLAASKRAMRNMGSAAE